MLRLKEINEEIIIHRIRVVNTKIRVDPVRSEARIQPRLRYHKPWIVFLELPNY